MVVIDIPTGDAKPVASKPYPIPEKYKAAVMAEMQKLLTQKLEKFLLVDLPADRTTKFPLSESKIDKNRDEKRAVALFLGAGHRGSKKVKAEDMLRAVCKLRGVQSEYFNEQAAASTQ